MMKSSFQIQFAGKEYVEKEIIAQIKEYWAESGHKIKDIQTLDVYCKPEEQMIYYVINQTEKGTIAM